MPLSPSIEPLESRIAPAFAAVFELSSLDGSNGFTINGVAANDHAGESVSDAGDVNGDGFADIIISAPKVRINGTYSGACYVVFGKANGIPAELDPSTLDGSNGFKISGARASKEEVAAGDVNDDGYSDLIIGDHNASPNGSFSGATYIVFGKADGFQPDLDVSSLNGANGFRISGAEAYDFSGYSVSDAGDVNGDGVDDMIIAAPKRLYSGNLLTYVVFGKRSGFTSDLHLSTIDGTNGFTFSAIPTEPHERPRSVSGAGDINGDGFDDLIIGAYHINGTTCMNYVVFGTDKGFAAVLDSSALDGTNGFRISGAPGTGGTGYAVSGAGDINGDGFDDAIVGVQHFNPLGDVDSGASYVIFGKAGVFTSDFNLSNLNGSNGFTVSGAEVGDRFGFSVHGGGDVNGDGHDDVIVSALAADPNGSNSGASYVIFGRAGGFGANLNVSTLDGSNGFKLNGVSADDTSGRSVSMGDVNGDGFDDVIISASFADPNGKLQAGSTYVVFGQGSGSRSISIGDASLTEGNADASEMTFLVTLSSASTEPVTVQFSTVDGTAKAGIDYAALAPGTLTFAPGETTKTLTINVTGDALYEADETFSVVLSNPSGAALGHATGLGTILNDDVAPVVSITGDTVLEGDSGTSVLTFTITLSAESGLPVTVSYHAADGTAKTGSDYAAPVPGTLTFAPGEMTKILTIQTLGDSSIEDHEQFSVILTGAGGATIGTDTATGQILNDDTAIRISNVIAAEGDSGTKPFDFIVTLAKASALPVTVNYTTTDGTASQGSDFTALAPDSQLTFAPGEISKTITVDVHGDTDDESDETFSVVLSGATNASVTDATGIGTILDDDAPPRPSIRIADASVLEGHSGTHPMNFTVTLSTAYPLPVSVDFASTSGTAVAGADYTALTPGTLQFAPGETSKTISIDVFGDTTVEALKTFSVVLSNPLNVTLDRATASGAILDDDVTLVSPREATYHNPNGDLVTIKVSKGTLKVEDFTIVPRGAGAELALVDLSGQPEFAGAKLSITAQTPRGSTGIGAADVGFINASGIDLGKVTISGDLCQIDCGDGDAAKPALKSLLVGSLGARGLATQLPGQSASLHSDIDGDLRKLIVNGGMSGSSALAIGGRLGSAAIKGDVDQATISALGLLNARTSAEAVAIGKLTIGGSIAQSQILAGYGRTGAALNPDASIGRIVVGGNWSASSAVAGVADVTSDGFGQNDALIPGDTSPTLLARIASLTIRGNASGSTEDGDHFAITAQQLGKLSINHSRVSLTSSTDDILLDPVHGDLTAVDFA